VGLDREDEPAREAAAIAEVARLVASAGPAPRALPFFGMDHPSGTRLELLDELAGRGIFRKYEHVLLPGAGLGAGARYLAVRLGCTATATSATADEAQRAHLLTARAGLDWQVFHAGAAPDALPFATAAFTHVWIVETLPRLGAVAHVLAEAARVLRPGGHFAVQDLVDHDGGELAERGHVTAREREGQLGAAGFVEIVGRDVTAQARDHRSDDAAAWQRLARRFGGQHPLVRERNLIASALEGGRLRVAQFTARRP